MRSAAILIGLIVVLALGTWYRSTMHTSQPTDLSTKVVVIGDTSVRAQVADTDAMREQGLSGRTSLASGTGMLFLFDSPGRWGFWMKDMNFPLDIIFADQNGTIVSVYQNLSPDTYRENPPQVFYPAAPASSVLEVPAGFSAAHGVAVGGKLVVQ